MLKTRHKITLALALATSLQAYAGDQQFCSKAASDYARWVAESKARLSPQTLDQLQLKVAQKQEFSGVANRLGNRANMLLDKNVTESEARTDLYALCMNIT